ncbi:MAG: flippase-like domain-containing protein [Dehalococcoidia bacterium]|nr:flippase-like domain-containing protein [Dehalococcoidia bacterium]
MNKRTLLGGFVSLVFLGLLAYHTDPAKTLEALSRGKYWLLAPGIAIFFTGVWFRALRWHYLLRPLGNITVGRLYPIVIVGYTVNNLLPVRVGEIARSYLVGEKERLSKVAVLGTIAAERLLDGITLLFFAGLAAVLLPIEEPLNGVLKGMALFYLMALTAILVISSSPKRTESLLSTCIKILPSTMRPKARATALLLVSGLRAVSNPYWLGGAAFFSALSWLTEGIFFYFVGLALDINQPISVYLLAMAAANLATSIPSSQAGIGPFEYFCALVLIQFGTSPELATAYALVVHAALIVPIVLVGLFYLWSKHMPWKDITSLSTAPSPAPVNLAIGGEEEGKRGETWNTQS